MNQSKLNVLAISDSGFVFDPSTGNSFNTNTVGLNIIKGLQKQLSIEEVAESLESLYDASLKEIQEDVIVFLKELKDFHLV